MFIITLLNAQILRKFSALILLFLLFSFLFADSCSIGCSNCQFDGSKMLSKCLKCKQGFILDDTNNQCNYQKCDQNLYLQEESNISMNKCVAICDQYYQPNSSSHVCNLLDQCPHNYITDTSYSNNQVLREITQISNNIFLIKYDGFLNFVNKETGELLYKYIQNSSTINIYFVSELVIQVFKEQTVNIWKIETNEFVQMTKVLQGIVSNQSQINKINDEFLYITSFDQQNKIIYFNIFKQKEINNQNWILSLSYSNQKIFLFSNLVVMYQESSIQIVSINRQINNQEFYFFEITKNSVCNIPITQTIISLVNSNQHNKIVIQFQNYQSIIVINQQSQNCQQININQQVNKILIYQRQNKSDILFIQLDSSIIIRSFNDLQNNINQINFNYSILDILLYQTLQKVQFFILSSQKDVQWLSSENLDDNSNYSFVSKEQIKIENPTKLIPSYNSDNSLASFFVVSFDFQYFDFQKLQNISTKYIVKSFRQTYQASKKQIVKIYFDEQQSLIYQCSNDGMVIVWNVITNYRVEYFKEYLFESDSCRDFVLLKSKIIAVVLSSQIAIFDVTFPNQKQYISLPNQSPITKYSLNCNQEYILIQLYNCLKLIDQYQNIIINKCQPEISSFLNSYISINKTIYSFGTTFIKSYQIDLVNFDLQELPHGINTIQTIQYFQVDESLENIVLLIYFDSSKKFIILDQSFKSIISTQIQTVDRVFNVIPLKDPDNIIRVFFNAILSDTSLSARFTSQTIKQGETNPFIHSYGTFTSGNLKVFYYYNSLGELIYKVFGYASASYFSVTYCIKWNFTRNILGTPEQSTIRREDEISKVLINQKLNQMYIGLSNGLLTVSPYIKDYTEIIYKNDQEDNTDIMQVQQSYQINRIFIIKKYIIEFDMILNQRIENILFDDEGINSKEDIKQFQINNNLRTIAFFKSFQLILKNYSEQQAMTYKIKNIGTITNYFFHEQQQAIYIYGTKLSKYDLKLQNEQVIIPPQPSNKLINQCIQTNSFIICKHGDFSMIFINNADFSTFKQFEVTGIEAEFLLTIDTQNEYLFLYKKTILVYTMQGVYLKIIQQPSQNIIEFNFYGPKIVIFTIGNAYVYQRQTLEYQAIFISFLGGTVKKSMYLPTLNYVYYFSNEISIGQIYVLNLDLLIELSPIKYNFFPDQQVINIINESESQIFFFLDSRGTLASYYYGGSIPDTNLTVDEFQLDLPKDFSVDFLTNNIIIYNSKLAIQFNLALSYRSFSTYFDPLITQCIIKYDNSNNKKYIISDSSSILYEYQNYSLVFSSYFNDKIIGIKQWSDQTIVIVYFSTYFIVYKNSQYNSKYLNNNYSYQVTGFRIYKFISDEIFMTHDFQLIHYNFLQNSIIKTLDLPKDKTQKCVQYFKEKSLLLLGSSNGTLIIYNILAKDSFSLSLQSNQGVSNILIVKEKFWIIQKNGILNIYTININQSSTPDSVLNLVQITKNSDQVQGTPIELNIIQVDELNSRYFVQFNKQKSVNVINLSNNILIQHLSFSSYEYNRFKITEKYIILYTISQLNVHRRNNLYFAFQIKSNNRREEITDLQIISEFIFIISFLKKLDIYYLPNQNNSAVLVDSLTATFPLVVSANYDQSSTLLNIVGYSTMNLFEKKYWLQNYSNQLVSCSSVIGGTTSIDVLKNLNIIQSKSNKKNQLFYINVIDMNPISGIDQSKTQLIIQSSFSQSQSFNINSNTFLQIKKDVFLKSFSFFFVEQGIYNFNQDTTQIFIEDIQIVTQKDKQNLSGIQLNFENKRLIVINNFKISLSDSGRILDQNSQNMLLNFLKFKNCDQVYIYRLQIISVDIAYMKVFAYFSQLNNVVIKDLTIQDSSFLIFALFENIQNLTIENVNISKNKASQLDYNSPQQIIVIQGCVNINIKQIIISDNIDYQILFITNQYEEINEEMHLKNDVITIYGINSTNNLISTQNFNQTFNQIVIQGTSISLDSIQYQYNKMNILIQKSKNLIIKNSKFLQNTNLSGGSIYLNDITGTCEFINSIFYQNKAFASGGAIFADNIYALKLDKQTQIFDNTAIIGGGIRIINSDQISVNREYFISVFNNKAEIYGNNIGTLPVDINIYSQQIISNNFIFIKSQTNQIQNINNYYGNLQIKQFQSGSSIQMFINYIDIEGKNIQFSSEKIKNKTYPEIIIGEIEQWTIELESQEVDKIQITGESSINYNKFDENNQSFTFNQMNINSIPNQSQYLILKYQINNQQKKGEVKVDFQFRPCILGEIYKQFSSTIYICEECPKDYYSNQIPDFSQKDKNECKKCPPEAEVCENNQIKLKQGYWKDYETGNAEKCDERQNSCNEVDEKSINGCVKGYVGPLCYQCDLTGQIWEKRYSVSSSNQQCNECSSIKIQYIVLSFISIGLFVYMLIQILSFIRNFQTFQTCYYLRLSNMLPISASQMRNQNSFYIKCLLNYLQLQSILVNYQIQYLPQSLFLIPNFFGEPSSQIIINSFCVISTDIINNLGQGKIQIIILSIVPFVYLIIILVIFFILEKLQLKRLQVKSFYKYTALNFIFIFFQSDSINSLTHFLTCRKIGSKSYISDDLLFDCNDPSYVQFQNYYAIPVLILWILIPIIIYFFLRKRAHILNHCSTIYKFGYYSIEYRESTYYWEFTRIYLKVIVVIFYTLYKQNGIIAHAIVIYFICVYISFLLKMKPFMNPKMMKLEELSYFVLIGTVLIYNLIDIYASKTLEILFIFVHSSFIIYIIWVIISNKFLTKRSVLGRIFIYLLKKILRKKLFQKIKLKMEVKFSTYVAWQKIRKNIVELTNQKAIQRVTQALPQNKQDSHIKHSLEKSNNNSFTSAVKQSSNLILSFNNMQKIMRLNSSPQSPNNQTEYLKSRFNQEREQIENSSPQQVRLHHCLSENYDTDRQTAREDGQEDMFIDDEKNLNSDIVASQQMQFKTKDQLETRRSRQSSYNNSCLLSGYNYPSTEIDTCRSPTNMQQADTILSDKF